MGTYIEYIRGIYNKAVEQNIVSSKRDFAREVGLSYSSFCQLLSSYGARRSGRSSLAKVREWARDKGLEVEKSPSKAPSEQESTGNICCPDGFFFRAKKDGYDWLSFRNEVAKEFLARSYKDVIAHPEAAESMIRASVAVANTLVKQLKESDNG